MTHVGGSVLSLALLLGAVQVPAGLVARAHPFTLNDVPYRVFLPNGYDQNRDYPLILFLHGGAGRGTDNVQQIAAGNGMLVDMFASAEARHPAVIVAPQTAGEHRVDATLSILREVMARTRVDRSRIYVVGQSLGGFGAMALLRQSDVFAGAVIIAAGAESDYAARLSSIPLWFLHGAQDDVVPIAGVRRLVAEIQKNGGNVKLTEYSGEGHGLAWLVVKEPALVDWLFAQRKR